MKKTERALLPAHVAALALRAAAVPASVAMLAGCGAPSDTAPSRLGPSGVGNPSAPADPSSGGGGQSGSNPGVPNDGVTFTDPVSNDPTNNANCVANTTGLVRDFQISHPDMEEPFIRDAKGMVAEQLGTDLKPVYVAPLDPNPPMPQTVPPLHIGGSHGQESFDQWYRDTPGINQTFEHMLMLTPSGSGISTFQTNMFFPIDNLGWGNEFLSHNYHFTFELHTTFLYNGGEVFTFTGDDDLFVFINRRLAIDLGGVHGALSDTVELDEIAASYGLVVDNTYPLDLFHAERHLADSNFRIDTSIAFNNCDPILIR